MKDKILNLAWSIAGTADAKFGRPMNRKCTQFPAYVEAYKGDPKAIGDSEYVQGFEDAYKGREPVLNTDSYLEGYGGGYATVEAQSALSEKMDCMRVRV